MRRSTACTPRSGTRSVTTRERRNEDDGRGADSCGDRRLARRGAALGALRRGSVAARTTGEERIRAEIDGLRRGAALGALRRGSVATRTMGRCVAELTATFERNTCLSSGCGDMIHLRVACVVVRSMAAAGDYLVGRGKPLHDGDFGGYS